MVMPRKLTFEGNASVGDTLLLPRKFEGWVFVERALSAVAKGGVVVVVGAVLATATLDRHV